VLLYKKFPIAIASCEFGSDGILRLFSIDGANFRQLIHDQGERMSAFFKSLISIPFEKILLLACEWFADNNSCIGVRVISATRHDEFVFAAAPHTWHGRKNDRFLRRYDTNALRQGYIRHTSGEWYEKHFKIDARN
jgi:hypothetical protein